jgi:hypothetical protein
MTKVRDAMSEVLDRLTVVDMVAAGDAGCRESHAGSTRGDRGRRTVGDTGRRLPPKLARWHKILNRAYSQRRGRAEWFRERREAMPDTG